MSNRLIIWTIGWLLILTACDPCDDCGEPLEYDPLISIKFIHQDSIASLDTLISQNKTLIAENDSLRVVFFDSIGSLSDSLEVIDSLVDAGETKFLSFQEALNQQIDSFTMLRDTLAVINSAYLKANGELNEVIAIIEGGLIAIDQMVILDNQREIEYEDSLETFGVPLLLGSTSTSYGLTISQEAFEMTLSYQPTETVSANGIVRIIGSDVKVSNYTFDSLRIDCRTNECNSNEATIYFYF